MEEKITKIIIWIIVLGVISYFLFLPTNIFRQPPQGVSPSQIY